MLAHSLLDNIANATVAWLGASLVQLQLCFDIFRGECDADLNATGDAT